MTTKDFIHFTVTFTRYQMKLVAPRRE